MRLCGYHRETVETGYDLLVHVGFTVEISLPSERIYIYLFAKLYFNTFYDRE